MRSKNINKKRGIIWVLLFFSLVFLNRIASSGEREYVKQRFSIKLTGGLSYIGFGDINTHLESYDNYLSERTNYEGGKTKTLHYGSDLEGELRLDINSKFAISIGTGYISEKNKSFLEYTGPFPFNFWHETHQSYFFKPKVEAVLFKFGIYYTFLLSSRFNLFLNGGLDYCFSQASLYKRHWAADDGWGSIYTKEEKFDVSAKILGFHGGIGFEYNITNNLALVLEAQGRYIKKKNLKRSRLYSLTSGMNLDGKEEGTLYIGESNLPYYGENTPDLVISQSKPTGDEFQNMREAVLDLSGFSLRLGIRIKVF
jgi:opacity protein-like surface antigen